MMVVGDFCGDKCLTHDSSKCICGNVEFRRGSTSYCCTPKDMPCQYENKTNTNGMNVICPKGKVMPWTSTCHGSCPSTRFNFMAIETNCSLAEDDHCPSSHWVSKICDGLGDRTDVSFYCEDGILCPTSNGRFKVQQCYEKYVPNLITLS